jgi:hypothetical protein
LRLRSWFRCCGLLGRRKGRRSNGSDRARLEDREQLTARHDGAIDGDDLLDDSIYGRWDFEHDLVRLEIHEVFLAAHGITRLLVPSDQRGVGHGFG